MYLEDGLSSSKFSMTSRDSSLTCLTNSSSSRAFCFSIASLSSCFSSTHASSGIVILWSASADKDLSFDYLNYNNYIYRDLWK